MSSSFPFSTSLFSTSLRILDVTSMSLQRFPAYPLLMLGIFQGVERFFECFEIGCFYSDRLSSVVLGFLSYGVEALAWVFLWLFRLRFEVGGERLATHFICFFTRAFV